MSIRVPKSKYATSVGILFALLAVSEMTWGADVDGSAGGDVSMSQRRRTDPVTDLYTPRTDAEKVAAERFCDEHVEFTRMWGSGPARNRVIQLYFPAYRDQWPALFFKGGSMQNVAADYNFRVKVAVDQYARANYDTAFVLDEDTYPQDGGDDHYIPYGNPILRTIYERYAPVHQIWKLDPFKPGYALDPHFPFWSRGAISNLLERKLQEHPEFGKEEGKGGRRFFRWGVTGAGATGRIANSMISATPHMTHPRKASIWCWVHEGTHSNHELGHGNVRKPFHSPDSKQGSTSYQMTFEPTAAYWGHWVGYIGRAATTPDRADMFYPTLHGSCSRHKRLGFQDTAKDNATISPNRGDGVIHNYYLHGQIKPMDDHTPISAVLTDPDHLAVKVISPSIFEVRWFINGEELADRRGRERLDIGDLDLAAGTHHITAETYDRCIDYAFTGDHDLDLVRQDFDTLAQQAGWTVNISDGGENRYDVNAVLSAKGNTLTHKALNTPASDRALVLPFTDSDRELNMPGSMTAEGLRSEGNYAIGGDGTLEISDSRLHALPNTRTRIGVRTVFKEGLTKTGLGEMVLAGVNTFSKRRCTIEAGTLSALSLGALGKDLPVAIGRGGALELGGGARAGDVSMEGFSALFCAGNAGETASIEDLSITRVGNKQIGEQFHGYVKLSGEGTFAVNGDVTLSNSVLVCTGAQPANDRMYLNRHWMLGFAPNATMVVNGNVSGKGSMSFLHQGHAKIVGDVTLEGVYEDLSKLDEFNGILSVIHGTRLTLGGAVQADKIDLGPFSTLEYNGATPLHTGLIPPVRLAKPGILYPGFFGRLCGTGDIGALAIPRMNARFSPGPYREVGRQRFLAGMLIDNLATYEWQLRDAAAPLDSAGLPTGWDCIDVTGTLDLNGLVGEAHLPAGSLAKLPRKIRKKIKIDDPEERVLLTVKVETLVDDLGALNFRPGEKKTFLIARADMIAGFHPDKFLVETYTPAEPGRGKKKPRGEPPPAIAMVQGKWSVRIDPSKTQLHLVHEPCTATEREAHEAANRKKQVYRAMPDWSPEAQKRKRDEE